MCTIGNFKKLKCTICIFCFLFFRVILGNILRKYLLKQTNILYKISIAFFLFEYKLQVNVNIKSLSSVVKQKLLRCWQSIYLLSVKHTRKLARFVLKTIPKFNLPLCRFIYFHSRVEAFCIIL